MELEFSNELFPILLSRSVDERGAGAAQAVGFLCLYPVKDVIIRPIDSVVSEVPRCEPK